MKEIPEEMMKFSKVSNTRGCKSLYPRLSFGFPVYYRNVIINMQHMVKVEAAAASAITGKCNVFIFTFSGDKWLESITVARTNCDQLHYHFAIIIESFSVDAHSIRNHLPMRRP